MVPFLPHLNASLNALATLLLLIGYALIRQRRETAHRRVMLACFGVSVLFLLSYGIYHYHVQSVRFPAYPPAAVRTIYRLILFSHIVLAALVPVMAIVAIALGLAGRRAAHRRIARWTFPIWLYVSITGVLVYLMLYQLYPPRESEVRIWQRRASSSLTVSRLEDGVGGPAVSTFPEAKS
jgi:putative membrane protein